jgi:DNA-binding transcriptional LysR family regulator
LNIQQLRYVVATAACGSMTAAAASLYVAQPALSRAIRLLERELELTLFSRAGRGIVLTPEGKAFTAQATKVLRSLDALLGIDYRQSGDAQLVIAASPTLQVSIAIPLLRALRDQGIAVHTRLLGCGDAAEVHELVRSRRAHLGICDQVIDTELVVVPLGKAEVRLVSPPGLDLRDPITIDDLAGTPLVLPTKGTVRRESFDAFFEMAGVAPIVAVESDERAVWLEAVLGGLASCVWHSVHSMSVPPDSVELRSFEPKMYQELNAVHRAEQCAPEAGMLHAIREFAELVAR